MSDQSIIEEERKRFATQGGKTTMKKYGKDYFREMGKLGAQKRWGKKAKAVEVTPPVKKPGRISKLKKVLFG